MRRLQEVLLHINNFALFSIVTEESQLAILCLASNIRAKVLDFEFILLNSDDDLVLVATGVTLLRDNANDFVERVLFILEIHALLVYQYHWVDLSVSPE